MRITTILSLVVAVTLGAAVLLAPGALAQNDGSIVIIEYDFAGQPGDQDATPASFVRSGLQVSDLSRGSALLPDAVGDSFSSSNWPHAFQDDAYYEFTVTPAAGATFRLSAIEFSQQRAHGGPTTIEVRTSIDNFEYPIAVASVTGTNRHNVSFDFRADALNGLTDELVVRIYGFGATNPAAPYRIANVISGHGGNAGPMRVLGDVEGSGPVSNESNPGADAFSVGSVFPHPVASRAALSFTLGTQEEVQAVLFDMLGRRVAVIEQGRFAAGSHTLTLDAAPLPNGIYVVQLRAGDQVASRRVTISR